MTTNFSAPFTKRFTKSVSKNNLKKSKLSKRTLGMESLESREMLSVNPLGIDYTAPDFVQTANVSQNDSQDFQTEVAAAGDVTVFEATTTNANAVTFSTTLEETSQGETYTLYYASGINSTYATADIQEWIAIETKTVESSASSVDFSSFNVVTKVPATTADQYIFFGVAKGDDATKNDVDLAEESDSVKIDAALVSNGTATASGVTTNAVTLTWAKPTTYTNGTAVKNIKTVKSYTLSFDDGTAQVISATDLKTKTTATLTGLQGNISYTITAIVDEKVASGSGDANVAVIVASGTVNLAETGDAADVAVGPPTDVKAVYTKASGNKDAGVKVTWKAPVNYIGGYEVTIHDVAAGTTTTGDIIRKIAPGEKLETIVNVGAAQGLLADAHRYEITVDTTATNGIDSTPTYVNVGDYKATVTVAPPATVAVAAAAASAPGIKVTITSAVSGGDQTVGYYVGVGATAPAFDKSKLSYYKATSVGDSIATDVTILQTATGNVHVWAVAQDGSTSTVVTQDISTNWGADYGAYTDTAANATSHLLGGDYEFTDLKTVNAAKQSNGTYTVTWVKAQLKAESATDDFTDSSNKDFKFELTGYRVSYTVQGSGVWQSTEVGDVETLANLTLQYGAKYDFKVEAIVTKYEEAAIGTGSWIGADTTKLIATPSASTTNSKKDVSTGNAPTITDSITVAETASANTGINDKVTISNTVSGTSYIVTLTDANKAVLGTKTFTATGTSIADIELAGTSGLTTANLTPKAKYTVTVQTTGSVPGTLSKGKTVTITAADFVSATLSDAKKTTINSVEIKVVPPKTGVPTGIHYIEYTNVVDAKGKADWNAAKLYTTNGTDPVAVTSNNNVIINKLDPSSQYFFRVVTVDTTYTDSSHEWDAMVKVSTSKELKIKTAAVPLPTIAKNGFALTEDSAFALKLAGNSMERVDALAATNKKVLGALASGTSVQPPVYVYTLIASTDTKTDKATGKLLGAEIVKDTDNDPVTLKVTNSNDTASTDKKVNDLVGDATFADIFAALEINNNNFSGVKSLNVQVQVDVYYGSISDNDPGSDGNVGADAIHFTLYSKASKIALPKWFV